MIHRALKLQHHRHTGKVLRHHHTSYRGIFLVLVLLGIVLGVSQYTMPASAEDLVVSAKISAPLPTTPATIDNIADNTQVTEANLTITGTCETLSPAIIVAIYRSGSPIGSTTCQPDGTFTVDVSLAPGENDLTARSVNITNDFGPDSTTIHVTYTPPAAPIPITPTAATPEDTPSPAEPPTPSEVTPPDPELKLSGLLIRSERAFITFGPGKPAVWNGSFAGGIPPYKVVIDWGDGTTETKNNLMPTPQEFSHTYQKMQTHYITFTVTDAAGQQSEYHFAAVTPFVAPQTTAPLLVTGQLSFPQLYAAYTSVVILGFLVWYETYIHLAAKAIHTIHLFGHKGK